MEFSWQEHWSELPFPSSGDLPNPGIEPGSPELQADSLLSEPPGKTLSRIVVISGYGVTILKLIFVSCGIQKMSACMCVLSCVQLFVTPWTVAHQAPLSMEFSRQEYWSGLPLPSPGELPEPGIEPSSLVSPMSKYINIVSNQGSHYW